MDLSLTNNSLPAFSALDNPIRLEIINLLSKSKMNVKEIATAVGLSSTITIMHLNKLEAAHIIRTEKHGNQRISILTVDNITIHFPKQLYVPYKKYEFNLPIGQYTNYQVKPTCGLAGQTGFIGQVDNPKYFMNPERTDAGMLWFSEGFVEYTVPNYLTSEQQIKMIEFTVELSSEFPFSNNNWLSDITIALAGKTLGTWTSPGDFSDVRGKYTPEWVYNDMNQYGLLKTIRISEYGSFIDGHHFSDVKISDINTHRDNWTLRFSVPQTAKHCGGCTIFGKHFGNYNQDIRFRTYYQEKE
ncbi:ArsR/SmtB family transcription factor [Levilactobacillus namurensis]|uniref:ArsR/SmtB family transcription factor n=1 Tax=Levilactobacillus namurensis TaxID=380393 RepID=UPI002232BDA9|nr:ArsR family transcriptional regulator [Levilactobacillus namurensis]MCW3778148.1 ArsR family transcriptional regulator [Levilactobacillus namurensis]MDT7018094.1 ArsR family transcriptional regulator [Levilactobacillus namurensis]WNN64916.1 ArsR family transcriptional regulator [Levilactobacillus namurensis]